MADVLPGQAILHSAFGRKVEPWMAILAGRRSSIPHYTRDRQRDSRTEGSGQSLSRRPWRREEMLEGGALVGDVVHNAAW